MKEMIQQELNSDTLKILANDVLQEAKHQGATSAEVDVHVHKGFNVTVRKGDVETVEYNQDKAIAMMINCVKRSGSTSLSDMRPEALRAAVKAACNIARFTDEDECAGLADKA